MRVGLRFKQQHITVDLRVEDGTYRATVDGAEHVIESQHVNDATLSLVVDGRRYRVDVARNGQERLVAVAGEVYRFAPESGGASAHSGCQALQFRALEPSACAIPTG